MIVPEVRNQLQDNTNASCHDNHIPEDDLWYWSQCWFTVSFFALVAKNLTFKCIYYLYILYYDILYYYLCIIYISNNIL